MGCGGCGRRPSVHERDALTGLLQYRARWYDPSQGRFISEDPAGFAGGVNLYAYAANNPLSFVDPFGLDALDTILGYSANISAGFGDTISFGLTRKIRQWMGTDDVIDPCSGAYGFGKGLGIAHQVATIIATGGAAAELEEGGALAEGTELAAEGTEAAEAAEGAEAVEAAEGAESANAIDPNKLNHIFGKAGHNLDPLVSEFGSQESAYNALQQATQTAVRNQGLNGLFKTTVQVGSETVTVTGRVIDGIARIGTAFKP